MEMLVHQERKTNLKEDEDNDEAHLNPGDFVKCEIDDNNINCKVYSKEKYYKSETEEGRNDIEGKGFTIKIEVPENDEDNYFDGEMEDSIEGNQEIYFKTEMEDTTEYPITNTHCDDFKEEFYQPKKFIFQQGNVWFIELEEGKVQCGTCGEAFARIISHLISNPNCAINLDLENFKTVWKKFKTEQRRKKYEEKRRTEDPEQYLKDQADRRKKYEEKKKAENPEEFLKNQAQRRKKYEEKKRAENPLQFLKDRAERRKRYEERKKAENPEKFFKDRAERQRRYAEKKKAQKYLSSKTEIVEKGECEQNNISVDS